jgi:hypothetical protein
VESVVGDVGSGGVSSTEIGGVMVKFTGSASSLEAAPISVELKPASSRLATDVEVLLLRTVSVTVDPDSADALGSLSLLPLIDVTRLLPITLITLIFSDEFESPTVANSPCAPSMILGMIRIRSSELSRLAALTDAVAASTIEVIWELVRELESVLLVLRDETLSCLELLVEERLALSSTITVEARVVVVVSVSVVSSVVPEASSILLDDIPSSSAVICPQEFKNIPRMITKVIETN